MAKELVGVRVPVAVAEQVDAYAETHEISKTEAIELLIRTGYDRSIPEGDRSVRGPEPEHTNSSSPGFEHIIRRKLQGAEPYHGDYENTRSPTARLPDGVVERIEDWQESQDVNRTNAAADLLERGLIIDPSPDQHDGDSVNMGITVALSPDEYEIFRKYRLSWKNTEPEAVQSLAMPSSSQKSISLEWGKPD
jgi:hypothetical protein